MRLVIVNVAVFLAIYLIAAIVSLAGGNFNPARYLELPSSFFAAAMQPWRFITYMFAHYDLLHILFNMLWLYCFGIVFMDHFSEKELVAAYFIGGIAGAVFYLCGNAVFPRIASNGLIGSSAAVLAVAAATVVRAPNYRINLMLIGMVPIKWIAVACIVLSLLTVGSHNLGGHIAHAGGIIAGILFALNARYKWIAAKSKNRRKAAILPKLHTKPIGKIQSKAEMEALLDRLLEKIKQSGYNSLSDKEKQTLDELSKKIKP